MTSTSSTIDPDAPALQATNLYRFYHAAGDETLALRGVSLRVERGEIVAVTGPSGSGKSTLMACLAGLDEPDGGLVRCLGETITRRSEAERAALRARSIGTLFQSGNLLDHLSVEQNVILAQRLAGKVDRGAAHELLDRVGLRRHMSAAPTTLSGGEAARAGLAVALANSPAVVLADEPTGELDGATAERLMDLLREHSNSGAAILIVTHNPTIAAQADRQISMIDGQISQEAT